MTEDDLIVHHYDASPFTQKTLRMLGFKGAKWFSIIGVALVIIVMIIYFIFN